MTILQIAPESPVWVKDLTVAVLWTHIDGGALSIVSGAVAITARKGETLHRFAGNVFFGAMLAMAGIGAVVAPLLPDRGSSVAGFLTLYLVLTGWATVRRKEGSVGRFEVAGLFAVLGVVAASIILNMIAATTPHHTIDKQPAQVLYAFTVIGAIAAAGDLNMILRGGLTGAARIARHLWRMCLALFVASGSFFLGQQKMLPQAWHGSPLLFVPALLPLVLMVYWLIRVKFTKWYRAAAAPA